MPERAERTLRITGIIINDIHTRDAGQFVDIDMVVYYFAPVFLYKIFAVSQLMCLFQIFFISERAVRAE